MQDKWVQELPDPCKIMELLNDPKHLNRGSLLICPYSKDKAEVSLETLGEMLPSLCFVHSAISRNWDVCIQFS